MGRFVVLFAALAFSGSAFAADIPFPTKAPPFQPAPTWTGCYVGGNVGYGWGRNQAITDDPAVVTPPVYAGSDTGTGIVGGGQFGCDYQMSNWVFGAQGMFDGANVEGSHHPTAAGFTANETLGFKTEWLATLTARIGYVIQPQVLVYLKGGAAWAHNTYSDDDAILVPPYFGSASATRNGGTIGGGLEYAFHRNWSLFAEYDYMDFGSRSTTISYATSNAGIVNPFTYDMKQNLQIVLFGINYRFGGTTF